MKTKIPSMLLAVALILSLSISTGAADNEEHAPMYESAGRCTPTLSFSGRNATCIASVKANESSAKITITMVLHKVEPTGVIVRKAKWSNLTGTGRLDVKRTYSGTVAKSNYRLYITGTIEDSTGSHPISANIQAYCP